MPVDPVVASFASAVESDLPGSWSGRKRGGLFPAAPLLAWESANLALSQACCAATT